MTTKARSSSQPKPGRHPKASGNNVRRVSIASGIGRILKNQGVGQVTKPPKGFGQ